MPYGHEQMLDGCFLRPQRWVILGGSPGANSRMPDQVPRQRRRLCRVLRLGRSVWVCGGRR